MTGVYISEICLIGLFAINTAPGPIVLMVIFLVGTICYHAMMRSALKPLTTYLPDGTEGEDQAALFTTTDHKAYDYATAGAPPSEAQSSNPKKFTAKKATLFAKLFNPSKFKSHTAVRSLVPDFPIPRYSEEDEALAYYDPAITSPVPSLWIVRDEMGISQREVRDSSEVVEISDEYAVFNEKNKVVWAMEGARLQDMPIYEKRIDY